MTDSLFWPLKFTDFLLTLVKYLPYGKCEIIYFVNCEIFCCRRQ